MLCLLKTEDPCKVCGAASNGFLCEQNTGSIQMLVLILAGGGGGCVCAELLGKNGNPEPNLLEQIPPSFGELQSLLLNPGAAFHSAFPFI